jgi:hypothetical protein|tara:strand:+ start:197 stop:1006 length:810 start_codon:yes stop_codon:yes gene_type:complete
MQPDDTLDEALDIELEEVETEDQDIGSESSSDTEEAQEKSTRPVFNEEQQKAFDSAIGDKVSKQRNAEKEAMRLRQENEQLRQQLPKEQAPEVPNVPDFYSLSDKEIQEKIRQRDDAIAKRAQYEASQSAMQAQMQNNEQELHRQNISRQNEKIASYADRAKKLGVKTENLQSAANKIGQFGIDPMLANHLLDLEDGSLGTLYLGENLLELDKIAGLPLNQALLYLDQTVMPKARKLKPNVNAAPDPVDTPQGSGSQPKGRGPKGATFE